MTVITPTFGPADAGLVDLGLGVKVYESGSWTLLHDYDVNNITIMDDNFYGWSGDVTAAGGYFVTWLLSDGTVVGGGDYTPASAVVFLPIVTPPAASVPAPGTFFTKRHDTHEPFVVQALYGTRPVDVRGATLTFNMKASSGGATPSDSAPLKVSKPAFAVTTPAALPPEYQSTPADGSWMAYQWDASGAPGDTDTDGTYLAEIQAVWPDGTKLTFPTTADLQREYYTVQIISDVDNS